MEAASPLLLLFCTGGQCVGDIQCSLPDTYVAYVHHLRPEVQNGRVVRLAYCWPWNQLFTEV